MKARIYFHDCPEQGDNLVEIEFEERPKVSETCRICYPVYCALEKGHDGPCSPTPAQPSGELQSAEKRTAAQLAEEIADVFLAMGREKAMTPEKIEEIVRKNSTAELSDETWKQFDWEAIAAEVTIETASE